MARAGRPAADNNSSPASSPPSTPSQSFSSDKENTSITSATGRKRRDQPIQSSSRQQPHANNNSASASASKRRRLAEQEPTMPPPSSRPAQATHRSREHTTRDYYDPEQDANERREVRRGMRQLATELKDYGDEYLQGDSTGIRDTILKADSYFQNVKQTSDAIIDSRILVQAADLGLKRTTQLALGDGSAGIDVDEFVSKCLSFMRRGGDAPNNSTQSTQQQRRRRSGLAAADDSDDEETMMADLNWEKLGREACIPYNRRPAVSGFLLGPLSTQKKVRQMTQRRTQMERVNPEDAIRPAQLREEDLDKQEDSNLTVLCTKIRVLLQREQGIRTANFEAKMEALDDEEEMPQEEVVAVMHECGIRDNGGISLFEFCINPHSFGQTVENLFYVSFLIRDGSVGLAVDEKGLPTLLFQERLTPEQARERGIQQRQAVFSLDFDTWERLIKTFKITKSIIPHRKEENHDDGRIGWV